MNFHFRLYRPQFPHCLRRINCCPTLRSDQARCHQSLYHLAVGVRIAANRQGRTARKDLICAPIPPNPALFSALALIVVHGHLLLHYLRLSNLVRCLLNFCQL